MKKISKELKEQIKLLREAELIGKKLDFDEVLENMYDLQSMALECREQEEYERCTNIITEIIDIINAKDYKYSDYENL